MKNMKSILCILSCTFILIAVTACNNDEVYDFPGDSMNRAYVKPFTGDGFIFMHTPVKSFSLLDFKMPVYVTRISSEDVKVSLVVDNSLVETYNAVNGTEYEAIPDNALMLENTTVTIPAGNYHSSDSIHVLANENMISDLRSEKGYLIPVKIVNVEGGGVVSSTNLDCTYLFVNSDIKDGMIDETAVDNDVTGTLVADRTGWNAYLANENGVDVTGEIANMFDGENATEWALSSSTPFQFVIDMRQVYDVTAIYSRYLYYGRIEYPTFSEGFEIEASQSGSDWENIGTVPSSVGGYFGTKNIILYAAVPMRYIRVTVPVISSYSGDKASANIGEFNVYVK